MGCSHYILEPEKPITIKVTCYDCGKEVNLETPLKGHERCMTKDFMYANGREFEALMVDIEISNTEER